MPNTRAPPWSREGPGMRRAVVLLAVGAVIAFLWLARSLLVPAAFGIFLALSVHPLVAALERRRVPHGLAAVIGTLLATGLLVAIGVVLYERFSAFADDLPGYEDRIRTALFGLRRHVAHLQAQGEQLVDPRHTSPASQPVPWGEILLGTAQGALTLAAEATVVVFVLYFALADGPRYRDKLLDHAGHSTVGRARVRAAVAELRRDVVQYVLNRVVLNAALGVVIGVIYALYGLEQAAVVGIVTALVHFVPYVGPAVGFVLPVAIAFLQYGRLRDVLLVGAIYVGLVSLQGNLIDPIFLGKQLRLNAFAVFLGSLFWFWLWGPIGLLLAVPLLSTLRVICRHVPRFRVVADFLAE